MAFISHGSDQALSGVSRASASLRADVACSHCGLPVAPGLVQEAEALQFCCDGCRTVYSVLAQCGLDAYYRLRAATTDEQAGPALTTGKAYAELDDPVFERLYVRALEDGTRRVELLLEGVHCAACVWLVERLPQLLPGVIESRLDLGRALVAVRWDPRAVQLSRVGQQLDRLGYPPHPPSKGSADEVSRREERTLLIRMAVAGFAAGNVMLMAAALYSGLFGGMEQSYSNLFRWGSLLVTLPSVAYSGSEFFRGAWGALRARTAHMDLPLSLGILAGFGWGAVNTLRGVGEVYFDSVTALVFLLLIGRWVQRRQQRRAARAAELLFALAPQTARLVEGERVREVPLEVVEPGSIVEIAAGERVPVDGIVVSGESALDTSWLNGESRPESVGPGSPVHAGHVNLAGLLRVRSERTGAETRMGQLLNQVEAASRRRAPVVLLANRLSGVFVLVVLALAAVTVAVWWPRAGGQAAIEHAVALLIVTCPCALGLATPLAIGAALGRAARQGLLIKGGDVLERLRPRATAAGTAPPLIVFDKTGTLTHGRLAVDKYFGDETLKPLVQAVESHSVHPIARALASELPEPCERLAVTELSEALGGGVRALVDGRRLLVGSPTWVSAELASSSQPQPIAASLGAELERLAAGGATPVLIALDGVVRAGLSLVDPLREEAPDILAELERRGFALGLLSGDHPQVVQVVAAKLGKAFCFAEGGVSPEQKLERVERLVRERTVIMVGDGVNDAAALSAASVGVAVHGGAEASLQAADVFSTRPGLRPLLDLVSGARAALRTVNRALAFSLGYNLIGAGLAVAGLINPLVAAVLMPISSLTVVTLAYRSRSFR